MNEKDRTVLHRVQTDELYAAIGRFAVKFEHVVHAMQMTVLQTLQVNGLSSQPLANAVTAGLTAEPMTRMFGAVVAEARRSDPGENERRIISNLLKRIRALTEQRNDVIHRTWFVGWASPDQSSFEETVSWKFKNTGDGATFSPRSSTAADFDELSKTADELTELVNRVTGCILLNQPVSAMMSLDGSGRAVITPQ